MTSTPKLKKVLARIFAGSSGRKEDLSESRADSSKRSKGWQPVAAPPSAEFIRAQTKLIGGDVLIVGLTRSQANALLDFAKSRGVAGGMSEDRLTRGEARRLNVDEDSVAINLGHTTECHKPLFRALGIPV